MTHIGLTFGLFGMALGLGAGCANIQADKQGIDSADTPVAVDDVDHAEIAFIWLQGDFDSSMQAQEDAEYYSVSLRMCAVKFPELGSRVLYVEQAMSSNLDSPYRQRLYNVESIDDRVASHVYEMSPAMETALVGGCDDTDSVRVTLDDIREKTGCTVWLEPDGEDRYVGGTEGNECSSQRSGASYATSEVILEPLGIASWDRGWSEDNEQVWGAVSGPYEFARMD
ncbi:MAG: chromophore lyase CpcT/CpeT [Myxococcota bacterium]